MDALIGADEDDDIVEGLLYVDPPGQHSAVGELEFNSVVEQVGVQRLLHQLQRVSRCGPVGHSINETYEFTFIKCSTFSKMLKSELFGKL